mmetsp:Transcript_31626/g.57540  ORF Transcript_31626/g.57540 Transcript_31626/m.57540 type:complete len:168 (-) Transcript_31626:268-771(-)|eukprot:CAMPEP_0197661534 /NCGR_PEP_ID=MMETSP1338-20131121/51512_1 /TAXON_ID=43686 ORGANISM="Pelagodinium beii, Strain RCC1491" /NCGR_SAMPLE_ID=MMETSP1338 /ASSEMBLY_ACC=CAM_ASM_000754 /LENGTH=167 /DNA_ID=CAMNT_0043239103 /DNA_START=121 /DNA_END=624 /DNA_ORIENTATION=-
MWRLFLAGASALLAVAAATDGQGMVSTSDERQASLPVAAGSSQESGADHQPDIEKALAIAAAAKKRLAEVERAEQKVKAQLHSAKQREAEEGLDEKKGEVFGAFFSGLLVTGFITTLVVLRNSYKALSVRQMATIVHLNEERVKLFTKLQQANALGADRLSVPLLPS